MEQSIPLTVTGLNPRKWLFNGGVVPAGSSAVDLVDGEVRELIRRRGLDPFIDPGPVRVLVRDVVADYSERSLSSALPPIGDPEGVVRDVLDRVAGYGPLQRWLDDPEVEEICIKDPLARGSAQPAP
jgi:pilus assembly protein CpaF